MKSSTYLSLGLLLAVVVWMLSGVVNSVPETQMLRQEEPRKPLQKMNVSVLEVKSEEITREIVVQGELEPLRRVEIRAQTASQVIALPVDKGETVDTDTLLIQLAEEDRTAQLKRAEAEVINQKLEVAGARKLNKQGLQAENRLKSAEAALAAANADLKRARLELEYTHIKAPFSGVLEERYVELGSHLERGDQVALLMDESVLKAVGRVSQQSATKLRLGQDIKLRLLDGREAEGRVTYISRLGDTETHSFRVEADVPNPEGLLNAGTSAELRIAINKEAAHFLSPAVFSLDDSGEVGVKSVNDDGVVRFYPIELVRTEADGVWVSGLPEQVRVIVQGQGFVTDGEPVIPVPAS
jgi:multidrug efflux system membrane fusion protein